MEFTNNFVLIVQTVFILFLEYYDQGPGPGQSSQNEGKPVNDCEIVCCSKNHRPYAEMIESRLKNIGLKVDVLFPNPKVDLDKVLNNIANRGVVFAIMVGPNNAEHHSVTLNILQGEQGTHRNMPLDDALAMIAQIYETNMNNKGQSMGMPEDVKNVFGFLMDSRPLSVMEYDKLIKYLVKKREVMLKNEYGDNIPVS